MDGERGRGHVRRESGERQPEWINYRIKSIMLKFYSSVSTDHRR